MMICQPQMNMPGAEGWNPHILQQPRQDSVNLLLLAAAALLLLLLLSGGSEDDDSD